MASPSGSLSLVPITNSPFDYLPYELVMKILRYALTYTEDNFLDPEDALNLEDTYYLPPAFYLAGHLSGMSNPWTISQVCRRWRQISLSDGRLWTSAIDVEYSEPAHLELIRCANPASLVIHCDDWDLDIRHDPQLFKKPGWEYALARVPNWASFSLRGSVNSNNMYPLTHALTQAAPILELFQINNIKMADPDAFYDGNLNDRLLVLPDNIFAGHAPCLKKFEVTNAYMRSSFNFSIWAGVTELFVSQCLGGLQGDKISSRKWLKVLGEMKQLEVLVLAWSYDYDYDDVYRFIPPDMERDHSIVNVADVHLEHLRELGLVATFERNILFDIFPKLVVPDACITSITIAHDNQDVLPFDWLRVGIERRILRWCAAHIPFRTSFLESTRLLGFQLELDPGTAKPRDYTIQFRYIDYEPDNNIPAAFNPTSRIWRILKQFKQASSHPLTVILDIELPLLLDFSVSKRVF